MTQWPLGVEPEPDLEAAEALRSAVLELDQHAAEGGWDQPGRLFALISTRVFAELERDAVKQMGLDPQDPGFTALEQELVAGTELEEALLSLSWPDLIEGCAVIVERLVLPPEAEAELPEDPEQAAAFAAAHPARQEVRMVAAALRAGHTYAALRLRADGDAVNPDLQLPPEEADLAVVHGPDVVPGLLGLLLETFAEDAAPAASASDDETE